MSEHFAGSVLLEARCRAEILSSSLSNFRIARSRHVAGQAWCCCGTVFAFYLSFTLLEHSPVRHLPRPCFPDYRSAVGAACDGGNTELLCMHHVQSS